MSFFGFFKVLGRWAARAFRFAEAAGLTDALIEHAAGVAGEASAKFAKNDERREWAIVALKAANPKVPDSVLRLALELGVQLWKRKG